MKKYFKLFILSFFSLSFIILLLSCSNNENNNTTKIPTTNNNEEIINNKLTDNEIIDLVINNFMPLTKVPRPSHHEEMISQYLMDYAEYKGLKPIRDKVNNVMFEIPATKGMEDIPLGILQGHMDMVVAVADDKLFDPLHDNIEVIRSADSLTANGTSLGADDGIGIAIIKGVVEGKMAHGPLRIIITVNEEDGMDGAKNVNDEWLDGAVFLINIDNEESEQVLVSTAAGNNLVVDEKVDFVEPTLNTPISIEISNLKGGHSGVDIDKGRLNGIRGLANFFNVLDENYINYELASFEGGTAGNAIPTKAKATLLIDDKDKNGVISLFNTYKNNIIDQYNNIEENIIFELKDSIPILKVLNKESQTGFIHFITNVNDGAKDESEDIEGLIESSSNLGIAKINPLTENVYFTTFMRSSKISIETIMLRGQMTLALECGFNPEYIHTADAWEYDENSKLLQIAKDVFKVQNGKDVIVAAVHAGVECGCFKKMNPTIDMISIGPDIQNPHTINETLFLNSIPRTWRLLEGLLINYKK